MRSMPTVYEVAERAGVSIASVSRVLAGHDRVRPETSARVLAAVAELGYVPSGAAQDLAGRRTAVLGLCFPDLIGDRDTGAPNSADQDSVHGDAMYWYDEVIRGMERAARRSRYALLIAASHESDDVNLVLTVAGRCDGLVILAGVGTGIGLWLVLVGLFPRPPHLATALRALDTPEPVEEPAGAQAGWTARLGRPAVGWLRRSGLPTSATRRDLAAIGKPSLSI